MEYRIDLVYEAVARVDSFMDYRSAAYFMLGTSSYDNEQQECDGER